MFNSQFTIKAQLTTNIFNALFILLISIFDLYSKGQYTEYVSLAFWAWIIFIAVIYYFKLNGINDELSESILSKVNKVSIEVIVGALIAVGMLATTPVTSFIFKSTNILGVVILSTLLLLTIFRLCLFVYYDRKGFYN